MTAKDFMRARLQAEDELLDDGELFPAARLVGLRIFRCANRATGNSFPSEITIARRLKVGERTVRLAIKQLAAAGYLNVTQRGRHNVYSPILSRRKPATIAAIDRNPSTPAKNDTNTGNELQQYRQPLPPNSVLNSVKNSREGSLARALPSGALREPLAREEQEIENEIAKELGWECFGNVPDDKAKDLRKGWRNMDKAERAELIAELKRKYGPQP